MASTAQKIFAEAARIVEQESNHVEFSCIAVTRAARASKKDYRYSMDLRDEYEAIFAPEARAAWPHGGAWGAWMHNVVDPRDSSSEAKQERRDCRVLALCFTAAMTDAERKAFSE